MRKTVLGIIVFLLGSFLQLQAQAPSTPNVLFILVDDLGYGDIGAFYQNLRRAQNDRSEPWLATPHLDQLAQSGVMLTEHYCGAPVCAPSRASLLTGLSQGHAAVRDNQFDKALPDNHTLGTVMQRAGYTTAAIGKWGLQGAGEGPDWPSHPLLRGFDYYLGYIRHRDGHEHYPVEAVYRAQAKVWENKTDIAPGLAKCYTGDLWTAAAKRWIMQETYRKERQPFFLYLAYDTPHAALELPTQAYPPGGGLNGGMQWLDTPGKMITTASGVPDSWVDPQYALATWDHDKNPATPEVPWPDTYVRYATVVSRIDQQVGDLLQLLEDLGIADNTLVVFTSDNGPSMESYLPKGFVENTPNFFNSFGPFDGIKRDVWEGGVRVPAIASWPGRIPADWQLKAPSAFNDWLPTLAQAAGLPAPAFSDGKTLLPLLTRQVTEEKRQVYVEYFQEGKTPSYAEFDPTHRGRQRGQMQMLRTGDTVAIRYNIQSAADDFEFYAIQQDPQQRHNLALTQDLKQQQETVKSAVLRMRRPDSTAARPYDAAFIPAVTPVGKGWKRARWRFTAGAFPWLPAANDLPAQQTGVAKSWSTIPLKQSGEGTIHVEGWIQVPADGEYTFTLTMQTPVLLKMHNSLLFNADYTFERGKKAVQSIGLSAGKHPYSLTFKKEKGLMIQPPQLEWQLAETTPGKE